MLRLVMMGFLISVLAGCAAANSDVQGVEEQSSTEQPSDPVTSSDSAALEEAGAPQAVRADLDDLGEAPELINEVWLNTDRPLRLAELRGKVVLLDMWTFG